MTMSKNSTEIIAENVNAKLYSKTSLLSDARLSIDIIKTVHETKPGKVTNECSICRSRYHGRQQIEYELGYGICAYRY